MTTKTMIRIITLSIGLLAAVPVMSYAQAQQASARPASLDARWTPYLGCWRLHQESVRASGVPVSDVMMVCVAPATSSSGVTLTTYAAGRPMLTQTIVADGQSHPVNEADCQGTQTNEWSRDGERLFARVDVSCNGRPRRNISGVTVMTNGPTWVDVQATDIDGDSQVRIRRYQRANERPAGEAELPADIFARAVADSQAVSGATMNLEDVIEASKKVSSPALEAALDETGARFNLNGRALKQLANAGVSANVIDLMIAQSFPNHFRVERSASGAPPVPSSISAGGTSIIYSGVPASMAYPYYDPYYSYYSYYSPFAYPYWGSNYYYNNYNYRGYPSTIIVPGGGYISGVGGGGGGTAISNGSADSPGMVVNGRGYTRVTPGSQPTTTSGDDSSGSQHTVSSPRTVRSTSGDSGSVSTSGYSGGGSSGGSTSGTSSSGGSTGGASSSGDSGGRTAQPR
jgi:hypothetical protein